MKHTIFLNLLTLCFGIALLLQAHSAAAQTGKQASTTAVKHTPTGNFTEVIDRKIPAADIHLLQQLIAGSDQAEYIKNDPSNKIYALDNDAFKGEIPVFRALNKEVVILDKNALLAINPTYFLTIDGYNKLENSCQAVVNVHKTENGQRKAVPTKTQILTKNGSTWSTRQ